MFRTLISQKLHLGRAQPFLGDGLRCRGPSISRIINRIDLHVEDSRVKRLLHTTASQSSSSTSSISIKREAKSEGDSNKSTFSRKIPKQTLVVAGFGLAALTYTTLSNGSEEVENDNQLRNKTWGELISLYLTYRLCTVTYLVKHGPEMLDLLKSLGLGGLGNFMVSSTFFATFCGGGDVNGMISTGKQLQQQGLGTIVDYAEEEIEFNVNTDMEQQRRAVMTRFTESILAASQIAAGSFVALRMTTFCPHHVLKNLTQACLSVKINHEQTCMEDEHFLQEHLSPWEIEAVHQAIDCLGQLVRVASKSGVHIMLDAETWETQVAIDHMFLQVLRETSKDAQSRSSRPTIFQTFQAYTKSCPERLEQAIRFSEANDCPLGVKLVRGAYVEAETKRAVDSGLSSPLWSSKEETDRCYNHAIVSFIERMRTNIISQSSNAGPVSIMLATHNEQSAMLGLQERAFLAREDRKRVFFAQLYGMGRELSQKVAQKASSGEEEDDTAPDVYKYVPYGPLDVVMNYLQRRATENLGMRSLAVHEYLAAGREMRRRVLG
ncbi:FAD-linked oxidoreductase [Meira miltonrushii]|uniref:Proline dehydrogenase n=1 Tax=Meira miltonrushii TaxID=1280837 RepID=A0A316V630_9BASI|nr:FAD-linked oxidoreductase [Meira miltonrushii]PWN32704.1 FAD-linked oxidoreductase [Meira miltonrushii]